MQKGKIGVTTENIFPIIKKFLYSDHEIFLRELISNGIDAIQKLKAMASAGDFKEELGELKVRVSVDKKKRTLTISDNGTGMTGEEVDKYINQIAFSSAEEFMEKYKNQANAIIGHFGLGFYSSFMVSDKVEIRTKSYKEGAPAVKWVCDGSPEFSLDETEKSERGTDIILHLDKESKEFADESRVRELLNKYCKFLPVAIAFGKETEFKDDKLVDTDKDKIINETSPAWTRKPADLKEEDYKKFYKTLYPDGEDPLFHIHLNVDFPFSLTGILYFPKIKSNIEIQKNKIQLYCRQVYVTDSVEGIVPEFMTLLHGVLDSPDIPLNVSRSYLQADQNVKKLSGHITKKVADRLTEIFKNDRVEFEKKWDNLKLFIEYGMMADEKFQEKAQKFFLLKNSDGKYFTFEEYETLIKENQTDKWGNMVHVYATDLEKQYSFVDAAKSKSYDVLVMDGQLDVHFINQLEQKLQKKTFKRVDADIIEKLVQKEDEKKTKLSDEQETDLRHVFISQLPPDSTFLVQFEDLGETGSPMVITQSEYMRRMKEMSSMGGGMNFYRELPDTYNLVINANHPLVEQVMTQKNSAVGTTVSEFNKQIEPLDTELKDLRKDDKAKEENKSKIEIVEGQLKDLREKKKEVLSSFGKEFKLVKQLVDLALLSNNMLKGEDLTRFVKRSVEFLKP